ncbi:copper resistance CopC/CopD family protein [Paenibacillus curdlanolyticus]|nr:copper resistance protein CopC [Paenibacillus curdlanolyticus]
MKRFTLSLMLLLSLLLWLSPIADAHAQLLETIPEAGEQLAASPPSVQLTFNEAIETSVGAIEVLDSQSRPIDPNATIQTNADHTQATVALPKLKEGVYTVTYRIISEDGHPVNGSYVFIVGNPPEAKDASTFDLHAQTGHAGHEATAAQLSPAEFVLYAVRVFYYGALLLATGIVLWSAMIRFDRAEAQPIVQKWSLLSMRALLFASILYVFFHAREVMEGQPLDEWARLFTRTGVGMIWLAAVVLSLIGFMILRGGRYVRFAWVLVLLAVESWSGHAAVNNPKALTVALDGVHLLAAAIWAGGLALLLVLWFQDRKEAGRFATRFSGGAVLSLAALVLTGVGMTLLFLPKLSYLWLTAWGVLLAIKAGLALLVIVAGVFLRLRVRRGDLPAPGLLKTDGLLMACIIIITALFTYVSPLPPNEPVSYHQMGSKMHVSLRVTPNKPGDNKVTLKIWLPEQTGEPKSVVLRFRSEKHPDAPIDIPLETYKDDEFDSFDGYVKATYRTEGPYIPYPDLWTAEIRVMDKEDNELVETTTFRNY